MPRVRSLSISVDAREHPAYHARRIWYGYGAWDYAAKPYADWCARNRATSGIMLHTGHAYGGIISRNKARFAAHPEYLGLLDGKRTSSKLCISNPGLRKLVVADAMAQFARKADLDSVSVDPSDGGGWCQCSRCAAMGPVTDRALTLANEVAAGVAAKVPGKYVGMYAYSQHSPPPTIRVHPRVVISVATAFIRGGHTVDELMDGWQKHGATLGVREYYSVHPWDRDLPGAARGADLDYIKTTVPHFHAKGARFFSAESSDNWGPNGLGYYLAARVLWDLREADRVEAIVADFLERSFGPARAPMAGFYRLIDGRSRPLLSDDLLGRMYRFLADARKRTADPAIHARIHHLILYTRYVELWLAYRLAEAAARQQAFETLIRYGYRMRKTMMIHAKALYRDVVRRDKKVSIPPEAQWQKPEGRNPWKSSRAFSASELAGFVTEGIARRKLRGFEAVSFSDELVPAGFSRPADAPGGSMGRYSRGTRTYHTWVDRKGATLTLTVRAGLIYTTRGPAKIALYPAGEAEAVSRAAVAPDRQEHTVRLKTPRAGLHRIEVSDAAAGTSVSWPDGMKMTVRSSPDAPASFHGRWSLWFYVPRGTKVVGGYASGPGVLLDGSGGKVYTFPRKADYFRVPVGAGQDGKLWRFDRCAGQRLLMTVPPYLARSPRELLLPAEVIRRDAAGERAGRNAR